jgi:hypothetical protein
MDHAAIEGANDPDAAHVRRLADAEAARIAQRAAEALRQSRRACQTQGVAVPTWTGRRGAAGAPPGAEGGGKAGRFGRVANPLLTRGGDRGRGGGGAGAAERPRDGASPGVKGKRGVGSGATPSASPPPAAAGGAGSGSQQASAAASPTGAGSAAVPPSSAALLARMRDRQRALVAEDIAPLAPAAAAAAAAACGRGGGARARGGGRGGGGVNSAAAGALRPLSSSPFASADGDGGGGGSGTASDGGGGGHGGAAPFDDQDGDLLAAQIVSFIEAQGGGATSERLVSHFRGAVPEGRMPLFKELLKRVAVLRRRGGGGGGGAVWELKAEFGGPGGG